ncbi:MAG: aliphatic sulfonate ABC transporter substrate-binding protein, partial [Roseibacillus sp.]|nr:aliphatic sulfonate ABC transporter substrate-binding protein [Roseibacillus sp.]
TVAVEEGVVDDYLLSLALEDVGLSRDDVLIKGMPTDQAAIAFAAGQVDAVGAFPPFTGTAMKREGARVIASSKEYPGAIPDLLTVSGDLIKERPDDVQKIVKTWWDVREFMEKNPEKSEAIMAKRAGIPTEEYAQYKDGTRFLTLDQNLEAFSNGQGMQFMPYAAESMADFMVSVGFIPEKPDMNKLFDASFIKSIAAS